jgi:hypothetical protein
MLGDDDPTVVCPIEYPLVRSVFVDLDDERTEKFAVELNPIPL